MKKKLQPLLILLFTFAIVNCYGQIPNNGFESWGTYTDFAAPHIVYDNPNGWTGALGTNPADTAYSIQKNSDNYPISTGLFSVIIKTNIGKGVIGLARTGSQTVLAPSFSITGHPTSLTGYYKFQPQNGDTMNINIVLFQSGVPVAGGTLKGTATISNWTSFIVPISSYTTADSAFIFLASCNSSGGAPIPHGNSTLYIDNINFDNLITSISDISETNNIFVYPNPFTPQLNFRLADKGQTIIILYDFLGRQILQQTFTNSTTINTEHLANGIYFYELHNDKTTLKTGKVVKQ